MEGAYGGPAGRPVPAPRSDRVSVAFIFTHTNQNRGVDVVPKIRAPNRFVNGFYDLFADALPELSNVGAYATFTDRAEDVTDPARRMKRDSLLAGSYDYTIQLRFRRETSFARTALGVLASTLTITVLPVPYTRHYALTAEVSDRAGRRIKVYERRARVTNWVQMLLVFVYPFHPEERKTEEVYLEFLHDLLRQIEADGILAPT
jgi:hypothetical protein